MCTGSSSVCVCVIWQYQNEKAHSILCIVFLDKCTRTATAYERLLICYCPFFFIIIRFVVDSFKTICRFCCCSATTTTVVVVVVAGEVIRRRSQCMKPLFVCYE